MSSYITTDGGIGQTSNLRSLWLTFERSRFTQKIAENHSFQVRAILCRRILLGGS
ncbi:hypothetical protein [Nostoc sp. DedQUE07]|uniref:hypothetical protein n=1 Tax=Nostoc sp. DedQUE07 TaxID=3075392 RepID=UPI002AD32545|nr:hypothetical protein [Nostoc sp. DedQUE07]MDZ8128228.1 hypothetical protein [Nostoc sp. DedQUE07]